MMYVCPCCKGSLREWHCESCDVTYPIVDGIPRLLPLDSADKSSTKLRDAYDQIYSHHTDVWTDQGRSADFQAYFASIIAEFEHADVLEIGCGEGALLASIPGGRKFGIDPSVHALLRARKRCDAEFATARCELLPFPSGAFDLVVAVGVMEHFEFIDRALAEIRRVLRNNGHYVALIQTDMTRIQRALHKFHQFVMPRFRPVALVKWVIKWLRKSMLHPIVQPNRRSYTIEAIRNHLAEGGFHVARIITRKTAPSAPLDGSHVVVLIAGKGGAA